MNSVPHKLSWIQESENRKVRSQHVLSDVSRLSTLDVDQTHPGIFSKFISCLTWFPRLSNVLLVSSRGGDISLVKLRSKTCHSLCTGRGRGAAITEIKCDWQSNKEACPLIGRDCTQR
jgi:WD40 repeat protein